MQLPKRILLVVAVLSASVAQAQQTKTQFLNGLIAKMTVEEKIGQLNLLTSFMDQTGPFMKEDYINDIQAGRCGSIFNAYTPQFTRQLQDVAMKTRLKIPLLFGYDVIHGHKTIFPIPLGEACTWDLELMKKSARIAALEAAADGLHWTYSPMVDVARDPRWGRVAEGVGEDTRFGEWVARAKVEGYQNGRNYKNTYTPSADVVLACVKHFALYGAIEAGRDYNTVDMSRIRMFETYLPPYKAAVDAGAATAMTSFNEIDGVPATGNKWLLTELLRKEWGFKGFIVTDYTAINEMINHGVAANEYEAGALALNAGVDMDMQGSVFTTQLAKLLQDKKINLKTIDEAVYRVLEAKYNLGLFKDPYLYCDSVKAKQVIMNPEHLQAAKDIAMRSIVLLKNDKVLPLQQQGRIAVIGPLADNQRDIIGNWSAAGDWQKATGLLQALKTKLGNKVQLTYAPGAYITDDTAMLRKLLNYRQLEPADTANAAKLRSEAVALARNADVVIMALGESQGMTGEAASRTDIGIPANQRQLLKEVLATGKPVVLVLMNGRPLTLEWEDAHVPAILETWFLGTQAGPAIADVLFGDYNPAGKLTMTFPRNVGQIPLYYNYKHTGRPIDPNNKYTSKYLDAPNTPLYPFGYGLSYTQFTYAELTNGAKLSSTGSLAVSVKVTNTGNYDGEEVVQLYVQDLVGSVTRPVKELIGFKKVLLKKGESRVVRFDIKASELAFYHSDLKKRLEAGDYKVYVGGNSRDVLEGRFSLSL
jgi:beta-glucosidase